MDPFDERVLKVLGDGKKRSFSQLFRRGWVFPQHFEGAPREPGGQRLGFEGENIQEGPWKTSNNRAVRTIHGVCIPSLQ